MKSHGQGVRNRVSISSVFLFLEFKEASRKGGYTPVAPAFRRRSSRLPRLRAFQDQRQKFKGWNEDKENNEGRGTQKELGLPIATFGLQTLPTPAQSKAVFPLLPAFGMGSALTLLVDCERG